MGKNPNIHQLMWYNHTMKYYMAIKRNEVYDNMAGPKNIMLNERSKPRKAIY